MKLFPTIGLYVSIAILWCAHAGRYYLSQLSGKRAQGVVQGVRVLLVRNGETVLVKHWYAPGAWTLPGGGVNANEEPEEAAMREVREETGFDIRSIEGEIGTYRGSLGKGDTVRVFFTSNFEGYMSLVPTLEIAVRAWFAIDDLPDNISPANRRRIEAYRDGMRGESGHW